MTENNVIHMPNRTVLHALCDRCYPEFLPPPEEVVTWCGEKMNSADFPTAGDGTEFDENGIPKNACQTCVDTFNCVTCGLPQDAYAEVDDSDD